MPPPQQSRTHNCSLSCHLQDQFATLRPCLQPTQVEIRRPLTEDGELAAQLSFSISDCAALSVGFES